MAKAKKTPVASSSTSTVLAQVSPIATGTILQAPPETLSLLEQVQAHVLLKKVGDAVENRLKELKEPLMAVTEAQGSQKENSTTVQLDVNGSTVTVEHRKSKTPDPDKLRELMQTKGVAVSECFDEVISLQLNPSKMEYLIQVGKLKADEVAALCGESQALRIYPSKELKELVASLGIGKSTKLLQE